MRPSFKRVPLEQAAREWYVRFGFTYLEKKAYLLSESGIALAALAGACSKAFGKRQKRARER